MKKKIQKPFDIEAAKNGAKVETRDGMPVRILCYDRLESKYPIVALVNYKSGESCYTYTIGGSLYCDEPSENDLVIVEEVEVTKFKEGDWVFRNTHGECPLLITAITSNGYEVQGSQEFKTDVHQETIDYNYHLWNIDDAKPGDVLVCEDGDRPFIFKGCIDEAHPGCPVAYCGISCNGEFTSSTCQIWWTDSSVRPAAYKERQQFFNRLEEEGYKWDAESLTLSKIQKRWRDDERAQIDGYFINGMSQISFRPGYNTCCYNNLFATEKQAKSVLAMARISQIMANDERFGGTITNEEWCNIHFKKSVIKRLPSIVVLDTAISAYNFLAFHTKEQAELFLKENEDLIRDYYMLD